MARSRLSLYLPCFLLSSPLNYAFIPIPTSLLFSVFTLSLSLHQQRPGEEISLLQRPDDVHTRPLRTETPPKKRELSLSHSLRVSLCCSKWQSLQRLSIALASHLLFSHDSDPPTPGISSFPTGDSASLGHIIKSVWGTSDGATPLSTATVSQLDDIQVKKHTTHESERLPKLALVK